jgi:HEAT repeat protein
MSEEKLKIYSSWLKGTIAAIKKFSFYPPGHPTQTAASTGPFELLQNILSQDQKVAVTVKEDKFIVNGQTLPEDFTQNIFYQLFKAAAIKSVEIRAGVSSEEFRAFLNYYARKMMDRHYEQTLEEYLTESGISTVVANKVQYVEVSEKEEVISKTEKVRIDLKAQLAEGLRENPQLLRDILFGGEVTQAVLQDKFQIDLPLDKVVSVVEQEVSKMSDQDILNLISNKIKKELEDVVAEEGQKQEELNTLLQALPSQELKALFPRLEEVLKRYGLFNEKVLKKVMSERWQKSEKLVDEINACLNGDRSNLAQATALADKVLQQKNQDISAYAIEKLAAELVSSPAPRDRNAGNLLEAILVRSWTQNREFEFNLIKDICREKLRELKLKESAYWELSRLSAKVLLALIRKKEYAAAKEMLLSVRSRCHKEVVFSEAVQKASLQVLEETGHQDNVKQIVQDWLQKQNPHLSQEAEGVLRVLGTRSVAEELFSQWSHNSLDLEQRVITLLESMPEATLSLLDELIGLRTGESSRENIQASLPEVNKMKSALKILSKIEEPQAVTLIGKLKADPDPALRLEAVRTLTQHLLKSEIKGALYPFLKDPDPRVRKEAIEAVVTAPDLRVIQVLINHFSENQADHKIVCQALSHLEGEYVSDFFLCILTGRSRKGFDFALKPEDEIRLVALNYLSRHPQPAIISQLENYLHEQRKNLFSFLKKDPLEGRIAALIANSKQLSHLSSQG